MEWYYIVMLTALYFTMGFGVFKLWKDVVRGASGLDGVAIFAIWPFILIIVVFCNRD